MSYEIPNFDPTSSQDNPDLPFSVWHGESNHNKFHVVHPEEVYRRIASGQVVNIADHKYSQGNIKHVSITAKDGQNFSNEPSSLYTGTINLRREQDWQDEFTRKVDSTKFDRLNIENFYWSNMRLLRRPDTNLIMQASIFNNQITLDNQAIGRGNDPLKSTRLSAPNRSDTKVGVQMSHILDSLSAMMCIAHSLGKSRIESPSKTFIITPDGPLFKNPDTGEYKHQIGRETIKISGSKKPKHEHPGFEQLFGIDEVRQELDPVVLFYKRPELAAKWRVQRPGNVLLYGPGGVGKTAVVHALAKEIGADTEEISPADIYGKWMGDSEKAIKSIFDKVRNAKKPTILLFDEMEGIVNVVDSDSSGSRSTNAVAGIFKTESARVTTENTNVILAATTNDPERLDPALIRAGRFDLRIGMGLPNDEARRQMFGNLILNYHDFDIDELDLGSETETEAKEFNPFSPALLSPDSLAELVQQTAHDFSAADIIESLRRASLAKASEEDRTGKEPEPIDLAFLTKIITSMRRNRT